MASPWQTLHFTRADALANETSEHWRTVVVSPGFAPTARRGEALRAEELSANSLVLLGECVRVLKSGELLFVYGAPPELAHWGKYLDQFVACSARLFFKYWIALELNDAPRAGFLKPAHLGLLLFQKAPASRLSPGPFPLEASAVRVPHASCAACGRSLKDWGGKKHLMNPKGAALSDVWRDLPKVSVRDNVAPEVVLNRIAALTKAKGGEALHVVQSGAALCASTGPARADLVLTAEESPVAPIRLRKLTRNQVYVADCVSFLQRVARLHPHGAFDLVFADPPYNLEKRYDVYADALAERHYVAWCDRWLEGLARALKPGGSLFVVNLPRWAMHHAAFLNPRLEFRHWTAWDALSEPRGRLMPAHYALLYYTKPGGKPVFNYAPLGPSLQPGNTPHPAGTHPLPLGRGEGRGEEPESRSRWAEAVQPPDAPKYCLRAACIRDRKVVGDDDKVELSDIWFDVHRIKHRRDRDAHPCQLPEKLMERIIRLTTRPGDLVFDPFCGAGTTAIAARKLGRDFVVVDVDPNYVRITREKLAAMRQRGESSGALAVPRQRVARPRKAASKRAIELALQDLARKLGRLPREADLEKQAPELLRQIALIYPYPGAALKRAKVVLPP